MDATMTITDDQIRQIRTEAGQAGDHHMAAICDVALGRALEAVINIGGGYPDVGDCVMGDDDHVYRVRAITSGVQTSGPGRGNRVHAIVDMAPDSADADPLHMLGATIVQPDIAEARAECARVISDAQAMEE
jgi:hypothetical protein